MPNCQCYGYVVVGKVFCTCRGGGGSRGKTKDQNDSFPFPRSVTLFTLSALWLVLLPAVAEGAPELTGSERIVLIGIKLPEKMLPGIETVPNNWYICVAPES